MTKGELGETLAISAREAEVGAHSAALPFARSVARDGTGGVPCVSLGDVPVALDTVRWRMGQAVRLTVVMKADFSVYPLLGTTAPSARPPRFHPVDVHFRDQPMVHISAASDRVPWKLSIDVTLLGHARAPLRKAVPVVDLRFCLHEGGAVYFDTRAQAAGDRETKDSAPEPFVTMPVVYERAYGGLGTPANPVGTGDDMDSPLPNIVDPANPWRPAAFGPIASRWPLRYRKLGALEQHDLERPMLVLPPDFDVSYFQSAPAAQQIAGIGPNATFVLEGFHAERPRVQFGLPQALPAGAVYGLSPGSPGAPTPIDFYMDTVHVNAQSWVLTLVYRACIAVPDEATFDRLTVAAGLGMNGHAPLWPETLQGLNEAPKTPRDARRGAPLPPKNDLTETMDLPASSQGAASSLPFGKRQSPFVAPAGAPPPPESLPVAPSPHLPPPERPAFAASMPAPPSSLETTLATPAALPAPTPASPAALSAPPAPPAPPPAPAAAPPASPAPATEAPARDPAKDPYGQAIPWARGPDPGDAQAPARAAPRPRPERKFTLKKGFGKR